MTEITLPISLGWRRLACAVLLRAWKDAHVPSPHRAAQEAGLPDGISLAEDARGFLTGDGARWLAGLLDLDPAGLELTQGLDCGNSDFVSLDE